MKQDIKIMTANILRFEDKRNLLGDEFVTGYRQYLEKYSPDVICLQEYEASINKDGSRDPDAELFEPEYCVINNLAAGMENHCAIASREPLFDYREVEIGHNANLQIGYLTVGTRRVCVCNTHLDSWEEGYRQEQIDCILSAVSDEEYLILSADFNTEDFGKFTESGYMLANRGEHGEFWSWDWWGDYGHDRAMRIDNVIVTPNIRINGVVMTETLTSDHHALCVDVTVI